MKIFWVYYMCPQNNLSMQLFNTFMTRQFGGNSGKYTILLKMS
jgi:hypothetical protein